MRRWMPVLGLFGLLAGCQFPKRVDQWVSPELAAHPEALPARAALLPAHADVGLLQASGDTLVDESRSAAAARLLEERLRERAPEALGLTLLPDSALTAQDEVVRETVEEYFQLLRGAGLPPHGGDPKGSPTLGPRLAVLADRGIPAVLVLAAQNWEPTAGRASWGWFTGGLGLYATTAETKAHLALLDTRTGNLLWAAEYVQSASAGGKTRSLGDPEAVAAVLDWLMKEFPRRPTEAAAVSAVATRR